MSDEKSMTKSHQTLLKLVARHTQSEIARVCGVNHAAVHRWLKRGKFPDKAYLGDVPYFKRLSDAFGVPIDDLMDRTRTN